ncbi:MAG: HEAT repeat domain-containing protein [Methanocorpusculum sp.]|nr:HEAT repeat domain-containing protein [Methanocorpusculum sp.]
MNEKTFVRLIADLNSGDFAKVEEAANTVCALRDCDVLPSIFHALDGGTPLVQRVMLWALRNYQGLPYADLARYLVSEDDGVREAAQVLFLEGDDTAAETLVSAVSSGDREMQYAAVETLGQFHNTLAIHPLMSAVQSPDADIREIAVSSLGMYRCPEVTAVLLAALADETGVRRAALCGLRGRRLSSDELLSVMPLLSDAAEEVRAAAVYVLDAAVPDAAAEDASPRVRRAAAEVAADRTVLERLCLDADSSVRTAAADAAAKHGLQMDDVILPLLHDAVPGVRRAAASALGNSSGEVVLQALIAALNDPKPGIRAAAATSLGKIGGDEAAAALEAAAKVKNPILAGIIKNALGNMAKKE